MHQNTAKSFCASCTVAGLTVLRYCVKSFTKTGHLIGHECTHTGDKPYECMYCVKSFTTSSHVMNHERSNAGGLKDNSLSQKLHACEKREDELDWYRCVQCVKVFRRRVDVVKHIVSVHCRVTEEYCACGLCGELSRDHDQTKCCFRKH